METGYIWVTPISHTNTNLRFPARQIFVSCQSLHDSSELRFRIFVTVVAPTEPDLQSY